MKQIYLITILLFLSISGFSQYDDSLSFAYDYLDANNIKARINANGHHFWKRAEDNTYELGFEFPKGSGKHTMFNSTIWIGGMDEDDSLRLAGELYNGSGYDYWTGPLSFENGWVECSWETANEWNRVWKLSASEIDYHIKHFADAGYTPIENIANWPAHGDTGNHQAALLAPFVDVDNNGTYEPMNGDYPLIKGNQSVFFIFNDYKYHSESHGKTIGLEIHAMAYVFNKPEDPAFNNTVFINYKIFNRSEHELHDTYLGGFADIDIGGWEDDFFSTDVQNGAIYCYNADAFDEDYESTPGYGENPPAQAIMLLAGPLKDENQTDDPTGGCDESINGIGFGDEIVDNERLGMTASRRLNSSIFWSCMVDAPIYYNFLTNKYRNDTPVQWPCDDSTNLIPLHFWMPAGSDNCNWGIDGNDCSSYSSWSDELDYPYPLNRFGLAISGPFTFKAHSVQNLDLAFVAARDFSDTSSVNLLKEYMAEIRSNFISNPDGFGDNYLGVDEQNKILESVEIFPNPVAKTLNVKYNHKTKLHFSIIDGWGRKIKSGKLTNNKIKVESLKPGLYILVLKSGNGIRALKFIKE